MINMVKGHLPCSPNGYCSNSFLSSSCMFSKSSVPSDSDRKQAIQANKYKQYTKQYIMSKQTVPKDVTHLYKRVNIRIT
jgi:hypothetical protein